jgi:type I restriction enzyme S subunit
MKVFPESWEVCPADTVCSEIVDCLNKTAPIVEHDTGYRMIRTTNVRHGRVDVSDNRFVEESVFKKWTRRARPRRGDIVLSREAPLGEVGLLRSDTKVFLGQRTMLYRANPQKLDQHYLYYQMCGPYVQAVIHGQGSGSTVAHLRVPDAETLPIPVASLSAQRKIAAVLAAYDELIENNKRRITLLEKLADEIYREWFVRRRFPGHENVKSVKGLHIGWQQRRIADFARCQYGYTESAVINDELPKFLRVMDINKASFICWSEVPNCRISDLEFHKLKLAQDDVVIARMADPGKVAIVEQDVNAVFASYLIKIAFDRGQVTPYYLFYTLRTEAYSGYFSGANSGATRGSINGTLIGNTKIIVPNRALLDRFEAVIRPIRAQLNNHLRGIEMLSQTRDRLLPRLISGKLSVENLDIQFPPGMAEAMEAVA